MMALHTASALITGSSDTLTPPCRVSQALRTASVGRARARTGCLCFTRVAVRQHSATCSPLRKRRKLIMAPVAARTESAELPTGIHAPPFELLEPLTGRTVSLSEFEGAKALLVIFLCNHCPFVIHLKGAFNKLAEDYKAKGVKVVGISSNSTKTHPQDGPEEMAADAKKWGYPFPYLFDESQEVAKKYRAVCTPEFFVFDGNLKLQYHGQFDSSRPSNDTPVTGEDVRAALDAIVSGQEPAKKVKPSIGCSIKWHPGSAAA